MIINNKIFNSLCFVVEILSYFNGMWFFVWDDDNDNIIGSCVFINNGGWWFRNCYQVNVNGLYGV